MGIYVVTGAASGIGEATARALTKQGHRVVTVDLEAADIAADLASPQGRTAALTAIHDSTDELDGIVTCAGVAGLPGRPGSLIASLNYFGSVVLLEGVRDLLAASGSGSAVAISSNSVTTVPKSMISADFIAACLGSDEPTARDVANQIGPLATYPSSKAAVSRWVRNNAVTNAWVGSGITLNAVAPGVTETAMVAETRDDPTIGKHFDAFPLPIGRGAKPAEIADLIVFLLGPSARFICGSVLYADGGTDALMNPEAF